jgi:hypothetical protein
MKNHNLCEAKFNDKVVVEQSPVFDRQGIKVEGLHVTWIILNNPDELNSYTTEMVKRLGARWGKHRFSAFVRGHRACRVQ